MGFLTIQQLIFYVQILIKLLIFSNALANHLTLKNLVIWLLLKIKIQSTLQLETALFLFFDTMSLNKNG